MDQELTLKSSLNAPEEAEELGTPLHTAVDLAADLSTDLTSAAATIGVPAWIVIPVPTATLQVLVQVPEVVAHHLDRSQEEDLREELGLVDVR